MMKSKPILLVGSPASGKTHIAKAIIDLQLVNSVHVDALDRESIVEYSNDDRVKLVVIEGVPSSNYLDAMWTGIKAVSKAAFIFTAQFEMDVPAGFTVINCNN